MSKQNTTRFILLGLLSHEDMSGYDMKKRMDIMVSSFWNVGYGQIYPTLAELEREGLIFKAAGAVSKGPQKNLYSITQAGREHLQAWLALPEEKEYTKYEILLKLFFSGSMPAADNVKRIQAFNERHRQNLGAILQFKSELAGILDTAPDHLYYYITVLFGEYVYKAYLQWADEALRLLGEAKTHADKE